jgi:integrase
MGLKSTGITNLFVSSYGNYYWKAKINGSVRQGTLGTKSMSTAKSRLYRRLQAGKRQYQGKHLGKIVTLGDWAREWLRRENKRPNIKPGTKYDYEKKIKSLEDAPVMSIAFARLNEEHCLEWWQELNDRVAPVTANSRFRVFRSVILLAMEETGRLDNPIKKLRRKPVRRTVRKIPGAQEIRKLAQTIREQGKRHSLECAAMVEFAAYSGARPAEVAAIRAEDIDGDWLVIRGGEDGTKNHEERLVPINKALKEVIEREGFEQRTGKLFHIKSTTRALHNACQRLRIDSVTPYTLRHFFATSCMEAGVDVATVADWMGHKDGGVLLLKTYTHVRRAHSLREASRLNF